MAISLGDWITTLEQHDLLHRVRDEVPIEQLASIVDRHYRKATYFERIAGYDMPLVANTFSNREMMKLALQTDEQHLLEALERRLASRIKPVTVREAPCQEVTISADQVNLAALPLHFQHELDAAPYISASVVAARDPQRGVTNLGVYRMMYRSRNQTGIDVTAPHKLRHYYQQACEAGKPLEIAVALGLPTIDIMAAIASAPFDVDEYEVLGGFRGEPAELVQCKSVDLQVPANAELILEGVMQPHGWVSDEGPYGEFTGTYGAGLKQNPTITITAITHRGNAIFHSGTHGGMHPGWTDVHVIFPIIELDLYKAMRQAGIDVRAVRVVPAGSCNWAVASIKPISKGDGKAALALMLAASRQAMPKFAVVVDEDIDVFDDEQLYWAMTWRSQPDQDVMILRDMKAVPLDPSLPTTMPPVTTSKMGIDATIPVGRNRADFMRCNPMPFDPDAPRKHAALSAPELDEQMLALIAEHGPCHFQAILTEFNGLGHRAILESFGRLRDNNRLGRDSIGRYVVADAR
jgi:4-hydroxy-3-polyprenylbenzoate decarboxylase